MDGIGISRIPERSIPPPPLPTFVASVLSFVFLLFLSFSLCLFLSFHSTNYDPHIRSSTNCLSKNPYRLYLAFLFVPPPYPYLVYYIKKTIDPKQWETLLFGFISSVSSICMYVCDLIRLLSLSLTLYAAKKTDLHLRSLRLRLVAIIVVVAGSVEHERMQVQSPCR